MRNVCQVNQVATTLDRCGAWTRWDATALLSVRVPSGLLDQKIEMD